MIELHPVVPTQSDYATDMIYDELARIQQALEKGYETPYGSLYSVIDKEALGTAEQLCKKLQALSPSLLMLVGIGGSNMGTLALLHALGKKSTLEFACADTIDDRYTSALIRQFRQTLAQGKRVILCIVTKSGTTPETAINGALFLEVLKEYHPHDYAQYVVTITDEGSPLYLTAQKEGYATLVIPQQVGGRYSVFTVVGLLPLALMGIDIRALCKGGARGLKAALAKGNINEVAHNTRALYLHYKGGYVIHNVFVFSPYLVLLAHWYKQLIGESLGKQHTTAGELAEVGFTPVVSLGTTDLHSVAQLYLAGPRNTFTTFLFFEDEQAELQVPKNLLSALVPGMAHRSVTEVKSAIVQGTIAAYNKQKRPSLVQGVEHTEESLGAFMIQKMVETMLLGRLFDINPFDQPAVELYKEETRSILKD